MPMEAVRNEVSSKETTGKEISNKETKEISNKETM